MKRGSRTLESIRRKQKRSRQKRKKQAWEVRLETELHKRWKERRENYEKGVQEDEDLLQVEQQKTKADSIQQQLYESQCTQL